MNIYIVLQQPSLSFSSSLTGGQEEDVYQAGRIPRSAKSETVASAPSLSFLVKVILEKFFPDVWALWWYIELGEGEVFIVFSECITSILENFPLIADAH